MRSVNNIINLNINSIKKKTNQQIACRMDQRLHTYNLISIRNSYFNLKEFIFSLLALILLNLLLCSSIYSVSFTRTFLSWLKSLSVYKQNIEIEKIFACEFCCAAKICWIHKVFFFFWIDDIIAKFNVFVS